MVERESPRGVQTLSRAAFTAVVDRHQHALHVFVRGMVQHEEQARDLVQDAFYDAWRATQSGTPPFLAGAPEEEMRRWLFHTAYCKAISHQRRRRLLRWEPLDIVGEQHLEVDRELPSFEELIVEGEALRGALAQLSPADAACLLLRVVQGFSAAEVGHIVGATSEVVTKRLSRAKQRLRAAYLAQDAHAQERRRS